MDQVRREEPDIAIEVPRMPERVGVKGVEFVEFAADEHEAKTLADMLRMLGFGHAGNHVSKDVELWRQGGINVVINAEKEGFAHSSYLVHGTTVCDIGLRVDDAAATADRARAMGAEPFRQRAGPE